MRKPGARKATPTPALAATATASDRTMSATQRARAPRPKRVPMPADDWRVRYCEALALNGGQRQAASDSAKISLRQVRRVRQSEPEFENAEREALATAKERVESEAIRRAVEGIEVRTVVTRRDGSTIETLERRYSDTIILRLLEKHETGSWRQRQQIEHSGGIAFKTRAERVAALEKARLATAQPVCAVNGRQ